MSSKTEEKYGLAVKGHKELKWVPLSKMRINPEAQRDFDQSWADRLFAEFDLDKCKAPEVNFRDGYYYIMDGQHTTDALKRYLGKWEDQRIECWVSTGLSEQEEAEMYLALNFRKAADIFQSFKIAIKAGRQMETEINDIVLSENLRISKEKIPGAVRAVGTLKRAFKRDGADALQRSLAIARDSFGDSGMEAVVIDGLSLLCHRYNGVLDARSAVDSLRKVNGGVKGLIGDAQTLRLKTGNQKSHCFAAACVVALNRHRDAKRKLAGWWKE